VIHPVTGFTGDFDDRSGIRIGGDGPTRRLCTAQEISGRIRADSADGAEARFGQADGFVEGHSLFRRGGIKDRFVGETQAVLGHFETNGDGFGKQFPGALGRLQRCISRHMVTRLE